MIRDLPSAVLATRIRDLGWQSGTRPENVATWYLHRGGWSPDILKQQYRVGRYRLDFAIPTLLIDIEVDGWHHRRPESASRDADRDHYLRCHDWLVFRVVHDESAHPSMFEAQIARVSEIAHCLRAWRRT